MSHFGYSFLPNLADVYVFVPSWVCHQKATGLQRIWVIKALATLAVSRRKGIKDYVCCPRGNIGHVKVRLVETHLYTWFRIVWIVSSKCSTPISFVAAISIQAFPERAFGTIVYSHFSASICWSNCLKVSTWSMCRYSLKSDYGFILQTGAAAWALQVMPSHPAHTAQRHGGRFKGINAMAFLCNDAAQYTHKRQFGMAHGYLAIMQPCVACVMSMETVMHKLPRDGPQRTMGLSSSGLAQQTQIES